MSTKVCIQGLGFVGAAMAAAAADAKGPSGDYLYSVTGVELDNDEGIKRVKCINSGLFPFPCEDESLTTAFSQAVARRNLVATTCKTAYSEADIVIIDVNLDMIEDGEKRTVGWKPFIAAIETVGKEIDVDTLVIVETTVPPGTCEKIVLPVLTQCFQDRGLNPDDILLAHSYERVMPGKNYLDSIKNYWRVYSACSPKAERQCRDFLKTIVNTDDYPLTKLASPRASEMAKVMENCYRAVNIALIEEWAQFAQQIDVDLFSVVDAIRKRPTHANMMYPGLGVGGYCLTKDPLFGEIAADEIFKLHEPKFPFANLGVETNKRMPEQTVAMLTKAIGSVFGKSVLLLGVSYRQDVGDTRFSPSEKLVRDLRNAGCQIVFHDPYVAYWTEMGESSCKGLPDVNDFDVVVLAVAHKEYRELDFISWFGEQRPFVLDANHVLVQEQLRVLNQMGVRVSCIGRGECV